MTAVARDRVSVVPLPQLAATMQQPVLFVGESGQSSCDLLAAVTRISFSTLGRAAAGLRHSRAPGIMPSCKAPRPFPPTPSTSLPYLSRSLLLCSRHIRRRIAGVFGDFYLVEGRPGVGRETWRGKVFASRTSCPTFRIFSSNDSRANFCRISGFIALAVSVYGMGGCLPILFCRGWPAGEVVRCAPCPSAAPHLRQWQRCVRRGKRSRA